MATAIEPPCPIICTRHISWRGGQSGREGEKLELGVVAHAGGGSRPRRSLEALRVALAPFSPPSETAPHGWVAYSNSPDPDEVRGAGIRLA